MCRDYIMHNDDTQDRYNLVYLVHNPRRDPLYHTRGMCPRRDLHNRYYTYSRDRNRRT